MRIAVLSDVHSNLEALQTVLADAEKQGRLDAIWSLGDLVGYGPLPHDCLALLRGYEFQSVAGNHDLAVIGSIDTKEFNPAAASANHWNAEQLLEEDREFLGSLPLTLTCEEIELAHGSLRAPVWEYMITLPAAIGQFERMLKRYSIVGHTHIPLAFRESDSGKAPTFWQIEDGDTVELGEDRLILNPGSVGQPRDGDPRAAYAIFDTGAATMTFHRVSYDIRRTQKAMRERGLPAPLITRLARGR
jgi:predicted phosphodiesterase